MSDFSDIEDEHQFGDPKNEDDAKRHAREQHNALERRRRDNIKDMYTSLREVVPDASSERTSRAMILKKAIETIEKGQADNVRLTNEISTLDEENKKLRVQIDRLRSKAGKQS